MINIKRFTFTTLAALAVTFLVQTPVARAEDHGQKGDDDRKQRIEDRFVIFLSGVYKPVPLGHGPKAT